MEPKEDFWARLQRLAFSISSPLSFPKDLMVLNWLYCIFSDTVYKETPCIARNVLNIPGMCWDVFLPWDDWSLLPTLLSSGETAGPFVFHDPPLQPSSWLQKGNSTKTTCHDFPGGLVVKNLPCNTGDASSILVWGTKISHARGATKRTYHGYWVLKSQLGSLQTTAKDLTRQKEDLICN